MFFIQKVIGNKLEKKRGRERKEKKKRDLVSHKSTNIIIN